MHSTGEVMGVGETFGEAYGKAMTAAGLSLPQAGLAAFTLVGRIDRQVSGDTPQWPGLRQ